MGLKEYLNKYAHLLDINQKEFFTKMHDEQVSFSDQIYLAKMIIEAGINLDPSLFAGYEKTYLLDNDNNVNKINVNNWKWLLNDLPKIELKIPLVTTWKKIELYDLNKYLTNPNNKLRQLPVSNQNHSNQAARLDQITLDLYYGLNTASVDVRFEDKYRNNFFVLSDFDSQVVKDNLLMIPGIGVGMNTSKLKDYLIKCYKGLEIVLNMYYQELKKKK